MSNPYIRFVLNKPGPSINIRPALAADIPAIAVIYNQAVALGYVTADSEPVDENSRMEAWLTITQKQQRPFWVAEAGGRVLAFFYFRNFYDRPAYRITAEIGIYLHDEAQGQGLGKKILDFCLEQAPGLGIENILALVFAANAPSIKLFSRAGFTEQGRFPKLARKGSAYNDLLILVKRLV